MKKMYFRILSFYVLFTLCGGYKPVIIVHGVLDGPTEMETLSAFIQKSHPGTNITLIDAYDGFASLRALQIQAKYIRPQMQDLMSRHPEGVHVIGYSQGSLLARGIIESIPDHNVINFISLAGPQGGQYGDTRIFRYLFPFYLKETLYRIFYSSYGQTISVANYWNDPHHQDLYLKYSNWLAVINNQRATNQSSEYKRSFTRLRNLVLIGGPSDKIITPWQSSHFEAYNTNETVVDMKSQEWYAKDLFGLKTLDKRGALHTYTVPGVVHEMWHRNLTVFKHCIESWLT